MYTGPHLSKCRVLSAPEPEMFFWEQREAWSIGFNFDSWDNIPVGAL